MRLFTLMVCLALSIAGAANTITPANQIIAAAHATPADGGLCTPIRALADHYNVSPQAGNIVEGVRAYTVPAQGATLEEQLDSGAAAVDARPGNPVWVNTLDGYRAKVFKINTQRIVFFAMPSNSASILCVITEHSRATP